MNTEIIQKMNELMITYRKAFVKQKADGSYSKVTHYNLNDGTIEQHLKGKETIGIYANEVSSFICFDIDTKEDAEKDCRQLVNTLVDRFNFSRDDLHISTSTNKGIHLHIYFTEVVSINILKRFYHDVIDKAGFTTDQIEVRPTKQALRLPLSIHKLTGKRTWYLDKNTYKPIESFEHILTINAISPEVIKNEYCEFNPFIISKEEYKEFEEITGSTNFSTQEIEDNIENVEFVLRNNHLRFAHSRNDTTLFLSIYLKDRYGYTQEQTQQTITNILLNTKQTKPMLISSSESFILKETKRIVKVVYDNDYKLKARSKDVIITKDEVLDILSIKEFHLKQLYLIHLVQSKRYAKNNGEYYITYETMSNMGATKNTKSLANYLKELEIREHIQVVQRRVWDSERIVAEGKAVYKPNIYKIKKIFNQDVDSIKIKDNDKLDLVTFLKSCDEQFQEIDLKSYLPRKQLEKVKKAV
ncbi:hypothetical protein [Mammaliicoccus sp. A-M4]|uniref:TOTE conflict system archaeo-eukaryotic primase domain-containing protein n=1 Tax=Mammaliicoccus sp. A-M4 TaxID=2898664 RepID=UPI001EFB8E9A|nr:hypothetical protein [Mammaliicoccus sp. A-M4]